MCAEGIFSPFSAIFCVFKGTVSAVCLFKKATIQACQSGRPTCQQSQRGRAEQFPDNLYALGDLLYCIDRKCVDMC